MRDVVIPGSAGIPACLAFRSKMQAGMPALPGDRVTNHL
jgi:hypothetical protein